MELRVRALAPSDDRSAFSCGDVDLDRFFRLYAGQNQFRHHIGTTYVAVADGSIVGFATVAPTQVEAAELAMLSRRSLPRYPLPALRLARLAVDSRWQGKGIGQFLLRTVFELAWRLADEFGCVGVVVDAKDQAVPFYEKLGFFKVGLEQGSLGTRPLPCTMFIELEAIAKPGDETHPT